MLKMSVARRSSAKVASGPYWSSYAASCPLSGSGVLQAMVRVEEEEVTTVRLPGAAGAVRGLIVKRLL